MASPDNSASRASSITGTRAKVSSACDSCKRRKVKCTGTQPCDKCLATGVACTYGRSASRTTAVSYTRHLEEKVAELQALLRQHSITQTAEEQSGLAEKTRESFRDRLVDTLTGSEDDYVFTTSGSGSSAFHGKFAGLSVLHTVRDLCTVALSNAEMPAGLSGKALAEAFDSNMLNLPAYNHMATFALLLSRERVEKTISVALDNALNCQECLDRENFGQRIATLYDRDAEDYSPGDRRLLGLVYSLMALGRRHEPDIAESAMDSGAQMIILKGVTYFRAARSIVDMSDVHDLDSIRSLIVMATSLRLGLHVSNPAKQEAFSLGELTERRQVLGVLNIMDTYVSSTLGMPNILRDADPKQVIPVPESEMHDLGRTFISQHSLSPISETLLCAKLSRVQAQIVQDHFPTSTRYRLNGHGKHEIDHTRIEQLELQLQTWHAELPSMSPNTVPSRCMRSQLLLRFAHTAIQISLYRPFLHHLLRHKSDPEFSYRGYTFALACIQAFMQAIWLIDSMDRHGYLHEAQWFNIYNLALAASCLHLFVLGTKKGRRWRRAGLRR